MQEQVLRDTLISAKSGDPVVREELIRSHKAFIARVSSKVCNRYLSWNNDDELSIALSAFNRFYPLKVFMQSPEKPGEKVQQ